VNKGCRYIRIGQLASRPGFEGMLPVSQPTVWRWVKLGTFPAPIKLGPQTTAWPVEAVEAWLKSRTAGSAA
jgi:prophage regulatory protein